MGDELDEEDKCCKTMPEAFTDLPESSLDSCLARWPAAANHHSRRRACTSSEPTVRRMRVTSLFTLPICGVVGLALTTEADRESEELRAGNTQLSCSLYTIYRLYVTSKMKSVRNSSPMLQ